MDQSGVLAEKASEPPTCPKRQGVARAMEYAAVVPCVAVRRGAKQTDKRGMPCVGLDEDFSHFVFKFACARSAPKFWRNLPVMPRVWGEICL